MRRQKNRQEGRQNRMKMGDWSPPPRRPAECGSDPISRNAAGILQRNLQPAQKRQCLRLQKPQGSPRLKNRQLLRCNQEGPTLKVVDGLEWTNVGTPLTVEKPTLQKVESALQKVDAITSENAKVSGEVEIHQQHPYLAELAEQFTHADGFRKAILNYEILGPPLSLRD